MDMSFSPEELAFRDEVREFIANNYPQDLKGGGQLDDHATLYLERGERARRDLAAAALRPLDGRPGHLFFRQ